jgi:hypothetical protein
VSIFEMRKADEKSDRVVAALVAVMLPFSHRSWRSPTTRWKYWLIFVDDDYGF